MDEKRLSSRLCERFHCCSLRRPELVVAGAEQQNRLTELRLNKSGCGERVGGHSIVFDNMVCQTVWVSRSRHVTVKKKKRALWVFFSCTEAYLWRWLTPINAPGRGWMASLLRNGGQLFNQPACFYITGEIHSGPLWVKTKWICPIIKKKKKKGALICSNDKSLAPDANTAGA